MLATHTHMAAMESPKKSAVKAHKYVREQRLLDNISALSEGNEEKRIVATSDIVTLLLSKQNQVSSHLSDNKRYNELDGFPNR